MSYGHATALLDILAHEAVRKVNETSILEDRLEACEIAEKLLAELKVTLQEELKATLPQIEDSPKDNV